MSEEDLYTLPVRPRPKTQCLRPIFIRSQLALYKKIRALRLLLVVEPFTEVGDPLGLFGDVDPEDGHEFITIRAPYGIAFFKLRPGA